MSWRESHRLLQELMAAPFASFTQSAYNAYKDTVEFFYHQTPEDLRHISIFSRDGSSQNAFLAVKGTKVCGATLLYRYLTGQWSGKMKRRLCRRLKSFNGEGWQCLLGGNGERYETEAYLSRELDGDMVRVYESGAVYVHDKPIMTSPGLYRTLDQRVAWYEAEHRNDDEYRDD